MCFAINAYFDEIKLSKDNFTKLVLSNLNDRNFSHNTQSRKNYNIKSVDKPVEIINNHQYDLEKDGKYFFKGENGKWFSLDGKKEEIIEDIFKTIVLSGGDYSPLVEAITTNGSHIVAGSCTSNYSS